MEVIHRMLLGFHFFIILLLTYHTGGFIIPHFIFLNLAFNLVLVQSSFKLFPDSLIYLVWVLMLKKVQVH